MDDVGTAVIGVRLVVHQPILADLSSAVLGLASHLERHCVPLGVRVGDGEVEAVCVLQQRVGGVPQQRRLVGDGGLDNGYSQHSGAHSVGTARAASFAVRRP